MNIGSRFVKNPAAKRGMQIGGSALMAAGSMGAGGALGAAGAAGGAAGGTAAAGSGAAGGAAAGGGAAGGAGGFSSMIPGMAAGAIQGGTSAAMQQPQQPVMQPMNNVQSLKGMNDDDSFSAENTAATRFQEILKQQEEERQRQINPVRSYDLYG